MWSLISGSFSLFSSLKGSWLYVGAGIIALIVGIYIYMLKADIKEAQLNAETIKVELARLEAEKAICISKLDESLVDLNIALAKVDEVNKRYTEFELNQKSISEKSSQAVKDLEKELEVLRNKKINAKITYEQAKKIVETDKEKAIDALLAVDILLD